MDVSIGTTICNSVRRAVSIVIVLYKRVSVNNDYDSNHPVHLFIDIDSHEEVYLSSPKVSFRSWSNCGQFSSSCANAINIGGSPGRIKSEILCGASLAFVPSSPMPI